MNTRTDGERGTPDLSRSTPSRVKVFRLILCATLLATALTTARSEVKLENLTLDLSVVKESQTVEPYFLVLDPEVGGFRIVNYDDFVDYYKLRGKVLSKAQLIKLVLADRARNPKAALDGEDKGRGLAAGLQGFKVVSDPTWLITRVFLVVLVFIVVIGAIFVLGSRARRQAKATPAR